MENKWSWDCVFLTVVQLHLNFCAFLAFHCRVFLVWFVFIFVYLICIVYYTLLLAYYIHLSIYIYGVYYYKYMQLTTHALALVANECLLVRTVVVVGVCSPLVHGVWPAFIH